MKLLLLAALFVAPLLARAADAPKPNVLFIAIDDLRDWVGYLGKNKQTATPNLDRLAARAVSFTHAYCAAPVCNPSRTALMSGMRPSTTGVYSNEDDWRPHIPEEKTLTAAFRRGDYSVKGSGKIYHEAYKRAGDWDDYLENTGKDPKPQGNDGVGGIKFAPLDCRDEDLREWKIVDYGIAELGQKHDRPFFLAVGLHKPHMPWNVPRKYFDMHPLSEIELPPTLSGDLDDLPPAAIRMAKPNGDHAEMLKSGRWKEAVQAYLAAISYCDAMIGRLLDAYDKSPERDQTIICLWSDHGWHLGEKQHWRKFALWEEATRSPVLWLVPGMTKPGVCERTVDHMHIFPTLTDLCGLPTPAHVEGKSIRSLLVDPKAEWSQPAVTTHMYRNHAVRTEAYRYIRYADGGEELYDEQADPNEWNNLAPAGNQTARKAELAAYLPKSDAAPVGDEDKGKGAGKRKRKGTNEQD